MQDFTCTLVNMMCAGTLEQTLSFALAALVGQVNPQWVCFLLWDTDLKRYIIGESWQHDQATGSTADLHRRVLRLANEAYTADMGTPRSLDASFWYQPLNSDNHHVGAACVGVEQVPDTTQEPYNQLFKVLSRTIYTNSRLEQADQERRELESERRRLEGLLRAVEDQQRTIDQLLAAERQLSASLETKVEERTAALRAAQNRLIQSEKLAVIGQLASSLAHELNNPLQAIKSGLGLVLTEMNGSPLRVREDLEIIQQELERIETIFRQMLDFYRPVSFEYLPLDVNSICEGVLILLRKRLQELGVTVHLDLADQLLTPCGDSNQIKQVLLNLVLNAAEAMTPEGGQIALGTETRSNCVLLTVQDSGHGILPEHRDRLFEPLFTTKTRGLGLGLAISREIVHRHGGDIIVESAPGKGTTFTISLPAKRDCHDEQ